jgi:M6 family metalloprotease-like protein
MNRFRILATISLLVSSFAIPTAQANNLDACRIQASQNQTVSLGFPLRKERLANLSKVRILVTPFKLEDNPTYVFTEMMKADYLRAARNIAEFSNGKTNIEFVFASTIETKLTNADMEQLKIAQQQQWQKDESKSTWGFVRKFIADNDAQLNYSGIDAVIIQGSSTSKFSDIAEAFMFWQNPQNPWFRSIQTNEGTINNAVLFDNESNQETITHEIMHLYGLTDLYGSNTGPGRLSLMASNALNLLSYEKWVLGWLPDSEVTCVSNLPTSSLTNFSFDYSKSDQLAVLRASNEDPYIVETTRSGGKKYIAFYSLNNEGRPPITLHEERGHALVGGVDIGDFRSIGLQLKSPNFTLLITNIEANKIAITIAPASQIDSVEFKDLIAKSNQIRSQIESENENKATAELKALQEAEEKAAAAQKAKQEAATKSTTVIKKKTTITCIKGKTIKKVTGFSPKCPSGYRKK